MEKFEVKILGCGSALPTTRLNPTSQIINFRDNLFLVDCGEGTQLQMRHMQLKFSRLSHIFLSHLHGDHCFGLIGLISTLGLLNRTGDLYIHAHPDAGKVFRPLLDYFCAGLPFEVVFNPIAPQTHSVILDERSYRVSSIPLKHRVPTCGFLFEEKPGLRHIVKESIDFYQVPVKMLLPIKEGADYITPEGKVIANELLTKPANPARKYAFCSDTAYTESIIPYIEGVDLLYHEATFSEADKARAKQTMHTTALQAAKIAEQAQVKQLIIGHFSARYTDLSGLLAEAQSGFVNTVLAKEGHTYRV